MTAIPRYVFFVVLTGPLKILYYSLVLLINNITYIYLIKTFLLTFITEFFSQFEAIIFEILFEIFTFFDSNEI